jgi:hypothetical protein
MAFRVEHESEPGKILVSKNYLDMFLHLPGDQFSRSLIKSPLKEYLGKHGEIEKFSASFVSWGNIGS